MSNRASSSGEIAEVGDPVLEATAETAGAAYDRLVEAGIAPGPDLVTMIERATLAIHQNGRFKDMATRLEEALVFVREAHEGPNRSITLHDSRCSICRRFWDAVIELHGTAGQGAM